MTDSDERPVRRGRMVISLILLATILGVIAAGQQYIVRRAEGEGPELLQILAFTVPFWYLWLVLAPLVAWFARHVPIERARLVRRVAGHLGLAVSLAVVHSLLHITVLLVAQRVAGLQMPEMSWLSLVLSFSWFQLTMNLLAYGGIVGVTYATDFYRRYRERELAASRLTSQLARTQLHALRMQLNPHFLFNAMNTISMLVRQRENDEAVEMLAGLSDLLRYMLEETAAQEVPVREELEFLERYLAIEQARFGDRLKVYVKKDDEVLDAYIPNLVLQPIVENAIRHGIARRADAGVLQVDVRRAGGKLVLQVTDDGPGITSHAADPCGVGIQNTRTRLAQLYGDDHDFDLRSADGMGAVATITLPFHLHPIAGDAATTR